MDGCAYCGYLEALLESLWRILQLDDQASVLDKEFEVCAFGKAKRLSQLLRDDDAPRPINRHVHGMKIPFHWYFSTGWPLGSR